TPLSGTQLDAAAFWTVGGMPGSVAGTFTYTPPAGAILAAGNNQTLSVSFAPTDPTDYTTATATATINILERGTTTTVVSSAPTTVPGRLVTFPAIVGTGLPAPSLATGSVQFQVNGQDVGSPVPLASNGTASYTTAFSAVGSYDVTAVYSGNNNFSGST